VLLFFYSYVDYVVNTETTIVLIDKHDGIDRISKYKIDGLSIQRVIPIQSPETFRPIS
jgi:hypothetical protein